MTLDRVFVGAAAVPVGLAALVIAAGLRRAITARGPSAAVVFGSSLMLALELLLAAGLLRLSTLRLPMVGVVAVVVVIRQVIGRGVRFGERAVAGRPAQSQ